MAWFRSVGYRVECHVFAAQQNRGHWGHNGWAGRGGDFRIVNSEPISKPGCFGAMGSSLTKLLFGKHYDVTLNRDELDRLITWMDANALFYGTFSHADQARQQRGEWIKGPDHQ